MLAYFDSCAGLVPVKIISASRDEFVVKVTSNNRKEYGYKHGEVFATTQRWIVPRDCVRHHKYGTNILSYSWAKILFGEVSQDLSKLKPGYGSAFMTVKY